MEGQRLDTIPFDTNVVQNGLEDSMYGGQPFIKTQVTQGTPPAGLGYVAPTNELFAKTTGDGPQTGWQQDGWMPIWNEKWFHEKTKKQMYDWNIVTPSSARADTLMWNQGVVFNNKGAPYVLPTIDKGRTLAHHPLPQVPI